MRNPAAKLWYRSSTPSSCSPSKRPLALCPAAKTTADAGTKDASESESETETEFEFEPPASLRFVRVRTPTARATRPSPSSTAGSNHDPLRRLTEPQIHARDARYPRAFRRMRTRRSVPRWGLPVTRISRGAPNATSALRTERTSSELRPMRVVSLPSDHVPAPLAVTQVAVRIEHATREERADVPPAGF